MRPYNPFDTNFQDEVILIRSITDVLDQPVIVCTKLDQTIIAANPAAQEKITIKPDQKQKLIDIFPEINYQITENSKISCPHQRITNLLFSRYPLLYGFLFLYQSHRRIRIKT